MGTQLKAEISAVEVELESLQNRLQTEGQRLPNLTHPAVPEGDEDSATVLKTVNSAIFYCHLVTSCDRQGG